MQLSGNITTIEGSIGNMLLKDLLPSSLLYETILEPMGDQQKSIDFSLQKKKLSYTKQEVSATLDVKPVRLVALHRLVKELQLYSNYLEHLKETTGIADVVDIAKLKATEQTEGIELRTTIMTFLATILNLQIMVDNPIIWVPRDSNALEFLEVNLGHIGLSTKLLAENIESPPSQSLLVGIQRHYYLGLQSRTTRSIASCC
jgi:hypothetical protein